ncbi:MAG: MFS transporter [Candidatus Hodarchaeales archaeon]
MPEPNLNFKSLIFDLYLKPTLLLIACYQIIVTGTFTAQQLLLAAYLDELGYLEQESILSGMILAVFFVFWFILGPISGTLSDRHGRKYLMIFGNVISGFAFIGFVLSPNPYFLLLMNALLGIGSALRIGSVIALWVQHSPKNRIGEAMAFINIVLAAGGVTAAILGFYLWTEIAEQSFVIFGLLLFVTAILIIPIPDNGDYTPFSIKETLSKLSFRVGTHYRENFFLSKPMVQLSIHWLAISTIVSFGTFLIPIIDRILEEIPDVDLHILNLFFIGLAFLGAALGGLIFWGRISDKWARKPVLVIGFLSTGGLISVIFFVFQFDLIADILEGMETMNPQVIIFLVICMILLFMMMSLIPAPMAWIVDIMGEENMGKAMSVRQALIAIGTIIGTSTGGFILGTFGITGLILAILLCLLISSIILF